MGLYIGGAPFGDGQFRGMGNMAVTVGAVGFGLHVHGLDAGFVAAPAVHLDDLAGFISGMDQVRNGFGYGGEDVPGAFLCLERDFGRDIVGRVAFVAGQFCVDRLLVGQGRLGHGVASAAESRLVRGRHGKRGADDAGSAGGER